MVGSEKLSSVEVVQRQMAFGYHYSLIIKDDALTLS